MDGNKENINLDLMRSMAVLYVVGFHLWSYFLQNHYLEKNQIWQFRIWSIGHWGVLIFFVHTCMVLMFSLERLESKRPDRSLYVGFLVQRTFRIFPLSIFIVLAVAIFGLPGLLADGRFAQVHLTSGGLIANLFLIQNLTHTPSITGPLWSLPYEMEMYLFLPAIYLLVRNVRWGSRWAVAPLLLWGGAVLLSTSIYRIDATGMDSTSVAPGTPDFFVYAPCFLAGAVGYMLSKGRGLRLPAGLWPVLLILVTAAYMARPSFKVGWVCCLVLGIAIPQFKEIASPVVGRIVQLIARYSYGVYLTHLLLVWVAFQAMGGLPMWGRVVVFAITAMLVPVALYHGIEKPMILLGKRIGAGDYSMRSLTDTLRPWRKAV